MDLPCIVVKHLMRAYARRMGICVTHLTETCKSWRNMIHDLLLEEREWYYIVRCGLVSRALMRDRTCDLQVAIILYGTHSDFCALSDNPPSEEDVIDVSKIITKCAEQGRWDLLEQLTIRGYPLHPHMVHSSWSKRVQECFYSPRRS